MINLSMTITLQFMCIGLCHSEQCVPPAAGQPARWPSAHFSWMSPVPLHPGGTHPG